ncbi:MAG: universal stress protein [Desulfobacca sp.]|nr:universal stress protein [Desulfobacca sp.]
MQPIKKIMVAVDFSEYSKPTLKFATHLATIHNAALVVVNVLNQRDLDAVQKIELEGVGISAEKFIVRQKSHREAATDQLLQEVGCLDPKTIKILRIGVPWFELLAAAKEQQVDLVVIGTKGKNSIPNTLFGSTAEKVFRRCSVPVLFVRGTEHETDV